jgi:hypothetical protein
MLTCVWKSVSTIAYDVIDYTTPHTILTLKCVSRQEKLLSRFPVYHLSSWCDEIFMCLQDLSVSEPTKRREGGLDEANFKGSLSLCLARSRDIGKINLCALFDFEISKRIIGFLPSAPVLRSLPREGKREIDFEEAKVDCEEFTL